MRLLYLALTAAGFGELVIAHNLARQLPDAEHHFVIDPSAKGMLEELGHPHTVLDPALGAGVRGVLDDVVKQTRPDAIVLADYFTYLVFFMFHLEGDHGLDPWFIEDYDVPIIPVDIYEWASTDFAIDITNGLAIPFDQHILDFKLHLRPVPVARPDAGNGPGFPYRLTTTDDRVPANVRREVRDRIGVRDTEPLLLIPMSGWQQPDEAHPTVAAMARRVPELLAHHLRQLPATTRFAFVGGVPDALAGLPAEQTRLLPIQSVDDYSALLGSSDAVLALNPGATTLVRAVMSDLPGFFLTNGHAVEGEADVEAVDKQVGGLTPTVRDWLAKTGAVHPFGLWPMSFHSFTKPLLTGNPYLDAVASAEILDERSVVDSLTALLYDTATKDRQSAARAAYRERVAALPSAAEALREAGRRHGFTAP